MKKKLLTLVALLTTVVSGAWADDPSSITYKTFDAGISYYAFTSDNATAAISGNWMNSGIDDITNKYGSINPSTGETVSPAQSFPGVRVKQQGAGANRSCIFYITNVSELTVYGVTGSGSVSRKVWVIATPTEGDVVSNSLVSAPAITASVTVSLDPSLNYKIQCCGTEESSNAANSNGQDCYIHGFKVTVPENDDRENLTLLFTPNNPSVAVGASVYTSLTWTEDTSGESAKYTVSYQSSDETIATVDSEGKITGEAEGTTTIIATVTATADATYKTTKASMTVTVYNASNYYILSTANTSIPLDQTNINTQAYLTVATNNWSSETTWDGITGQFYNLSSVGRYLALNVVGVAGFEVLEQNTTEGRTYGISVNGEEKVVITHGGTGIESSGIIATGSTGAVVIKLLGKGSGSTYPVRIKLYQDIASMTMNTFEWTTFVSDKALDFTSSDVKAYVVTGHTGNALDKTEVTKVAANTPLLLNAAAGNYNIPVSDSGTDYSNSNKLKAGTGAAVSAESGVTRYVLSKNPEDTALSFMKIVSGTPATVPTGKAYLEFDGEITAPVFGFGEATAIEAATKSQHTETVVYNLNGQRVDQPTKGLYIVNGRKVVVK